ncbi:MAG: cell division protein FtsA [Myxococcales bacterium]|jgi:cell division protein FtsA|nr:cell division protein FtsA [Myxococcales bacterium]
MARKTSELIVGLDIGTSKISCIIGEVTEAGIDVIGIGNYPSNGLRKGVVVNIEKTKNSIRRAVEEAELMAGCEVKTVYTGIAGGHIKGINSQGVVAVKGEVTEGDIQRVTDAAKAFRIPDDREIIHVLPQEYMVDEQGGIKDPLGMAGSRLEAKVHIVTGAVSSAQNIVKCVNETGLSVRDIVLQPLASAEACLGEDERELGVCLVDIGCGTADVAIFSGGSIVHTAVVALGGYNLTNDIAIGLRTPMDAAEKIKRKYGCALSSMVDKSEQLEVPSMGGRDPRLLTRQMLCQILEPRVEELFQLVHREIQMCGYEELLASGVVITGGSAQLQGMAELAEEVMHLPVRLGQPRGVGGLVDVVKSPIYATGVGLVLYGSHQEHDNTARFPKNRSEGKASRSMFDVIREIFRQWF